MFKKILTLVLVLALAVGCSVAMASCGGGSKTKDPSEVKAALIALHGTSSTYDKNFIEAFETACKNKGLKKENYTIITDIPEGTECYNEAANFADEGYDVIFADSFGHESHMLKAAKEFPEVQFCHATGTKAHTAGVANFHNAFASIYEGRFLAGVAAGLKLNELKAEGKLNGETPKMGYVGAYTYAEVISGYTSFYLGAKSVCPDVTMEVQFTGSWYDEIMEKEAATALINNGCDLISQHADSMGAPSVCEEKGVPNVSYNGATDEACPGTFIVSSRIDWAPYYLYIIKQACTGAEIATDWTGTIASGSVVLTGVNKTAAAEGTFEKIQEVAAKLQSGKIKVFNIDTFTVGGNKVTTYTADVDDLGDYIPETEAIKDGYFAESSDRSAPYFDLRIDGITLLNEKF